MKLNLANTHPAVPNPSSFEAANKSGHSRRKILSAIVAVIGILLLVAGLFFAYQLLQNDQDLRQQASTPSGTATVKIAPNSVQINTNASQIFTVSFNPQNNVISGISVRLQYPKANNQTLITPATPVTIITQSDSKWNCPVKSTENTPTLGIIDVGCLYIDTAGFTGQTDVPLFTVSITAGSTASNSPITLSFDPTQTVITRKSDNQDVAAIPQSSANITIIGANPTPTPTLVPSSTPTPQITPTPTPRPGSTATPTPTTGVISCNQNCIANRDCAGGLICINDRCLSERCPADSTCACHDYDPTAGTGSSELPDSGSISYTLLLLIVGVMMLVGSSSILIAQNKIRE